MAGCWERKREAIYTSLVKEGMFIAWELHCCKVLGRSVTSENKDLSVVCTAGTTEVKKKEILQSGSFGVGAPFLVCRSSGRMRPCPGTKVGLHWKE